MSQGGSQASHLPTKEHLRILREFLLARTRLAIRSPDKLTEDPLRSDFIHCAEALYQVVNILSRRVLDAVYAGDDAAGAGAAWGELLIIANAWQASPEMPIEVRQMIDRAFTVEPGTADC